MDRHQFLVATFFLLATTSAHAQPSREAYDLQDRCGRRAAEVFVKSYPNFKQGGRTHLYTYRNHYSPRLNKCFYIVQHLDYPDAKIDEALRELELFDVNENNRYGIFIGRRGSSPAMCEVQENKCKSEAEWQQFVGPYMDD